MRAKRRCDLGTDETADCSPDTPEREFAAALTSATGLLRGRATMLAGEGPLADDFVQATFERALRARHRPPVREIHPWLMRILRNVAIDHWRCTIVRHSCELDPEKTPVPLGADAPPWWREVDLADVERAARTLPATYRKLFLLRVKGVSNNDIARRLGLKAATVATRFFRGRRLLQRALATFPPAGRAE